MKLTSLGLIDAFTIRAVGTDEFEDVPVPPPPAQETQKS
jgi:hypothetical protein